MNLWPTLSCLSLFVRHVALRPISHAKRRRRGQTDLSNLREDVFANIHLELAHKLLWSRNEARFRPFDRNELNVGTSHDPNLISHRAIRWAVGQTDYWSEIGTIALTQVQSTLMVCKEMRQMIALGRCPHSRSCKTCARSISCIWTHPSTAFKDKRVTESLRQLD